MRLWIAYSDGTTFATEASPIGEDAHVGRNEIEEAWSTKGTAFWIPVDD
jgi:hypothetical protein